jgi:phosphomevalonate kinase
MAWVTGVLGAILSILEVGILTVLLIFATGIVDSPSALRKLFKSFKSCTVSAPGKALIAGGYLVLENPNVGIVVGATSRFFTTIKLIDGEKQESEDLVEIVVESPQFHATYKYWYNIDTKSLTLQGNDCNEFVEKCLVLVLNFIGEHLGEYKFKKKIISINEYGKLGIKLRADNDFYSQVAELQSSGKPLLSESLKNLPKFLPCPKDSEGKVLVAKTGMGSSAAMITSLVGALLQWFNVVHLSDSIEDMVGSIRERLTNHIATSASHVGAAYSKEFNIRHFEEDRTIVHNLAQLVHAAAQGKIGSGFDVAAAVYGTQVYRRFSPGPLAPCMEPGVSGRVIHDAVMDANRDMWDYKISPCTLPPGVDIIMGDVCGGSSSTSMAKKVMAWKTSGTQEASRIWNSLAVVNESINASLQVLNTSASKSQKIYRSSLDWASTIPADQWAKFEHSDVVLSELTRLRGLFKESRTLLRTMGEGAGVGIEPPEQTRLVDATESIPGVLCAGVPGAGGVDAVFALTLSPDARMRVEKVWSQWKDSENENKDAVVCPLTLTGSVNGSKGGIRFEKSIRW